jgi:hypothetical protein
MKGIRDAVQNVQTALENYHSIMSDSTERRINTVVMYGVAISEVGCSNGIIETFLTEGAGKSVRQSGSRRRKGYV